MENKILPVDYQTKIDMEENPEAIKPITQECKVMVIDDVALNDIWVKTDKGTSPAKIEYGTNIILAKSNLYKNRYYDLKNYNELYMEELIAIILDFALKMGAKHFSVSFKKVENKLSEQEVHLLQEANPSKSGVTGEENLNFKNNISKTSKTRQVIQEEHKNLKNNIPLSKEELQEWIRDEDIDINALPAFLGSYIKQYLAVGKVSGDITRTENLNISLQENAKFQAKINIGINIPKFISSNLKIQTQSSNNRSYSFAQSITYKITF